MNLQNILKKQINFIFNIFRKSYIKFEWTRVDCQTCQRWADVNDKIHVSCSKNMWWMYFIVDSLTFVGSNFHKLRQNCIFIDLHVLWFCAKILHAFPKEDLYICAPPIPIESMQISTWSIIWDLQHKLYP